MNLMNQQYTPYSGTDGDYSLNLNIYVEPNGDTKIPMVDAYNSVDGEFFGNLTINHKNIPDGCVGVPCEYPYYPQLLQTAGVIEYQHPIDSIIDDGVVIDCYELTHDALEEARFWAGLEVRYDKGL